MKIFGLERPLPSGTPSVYWPRNDDPPAIVICPDAKIAPFGPITPGACWPLGTPPYEAMTLPVELVTTVVLPLKSIDTVSNVPPILSFSTSVLVLELPVDCTLTAPTMYSPVLIDPDPPAVTFAPLM